MIIISAIGKNHQCIGKVVETYYAGRKEDALQLFEVIKNQHITTAKYLLVTHFNTCLHK